MGKTNALDIVFDGLAAGDVAAAMAALSADAVVWHCFDRIAHDRAGAAIAWAEFVNSFPERAFTDVRRQATSEGYVQQHVMTTRTRDGRCMAWEVCVVVVMDGERIRRLDEYIDRAGSFAPAEAEL